MDRPPQTVVTIVGAGTLLPDASRGSAAHLVEGDGFHVLLDCGSGTVHGLARHGVDWSSLTHLAISHYHNDHVGDLSGVVFALEHGLRPPREEPLTLIGPPGFTGFVEGLAAALGDHLANPGFPLRVVELGPEDVFEEGTLKLWAHPTPHTDESVAYRLETPAGVVGYTGDTGPSDEVARFLAGCSVLIGECALTDPPEMELHLAPSGLARLANLAEPGLLVVTHVYPPTRPARAVLQVAEQGFEGRIVAGSDGLTVWIDEGGPVIEVPID